MPSRSCDSVQSFLQLEWVPEWVQAGSESQPHQRGEVRIRRFVEAERKKCGHMKGGFLEGFRWVPTGRHFGKLWFRTRLLSI